MREKRRFIRFDTSLKVSYILQEDPKTEKIGILKDVSAGGAQLLTEKNIEVGKKLELKIFIPGALNPAHMKCIVLWSKGVAAGNKLSYCSGVEFAKIEEDNKTTFLKFLCDLMYKKD
ncbi:MAG: PilZ domain-containing protein [Candidatus Omnitrophica bacterium]|nr:PilZ domain-containing protein [Candidatus Omnitrophota bacterium]